MSENLNNHYSKAKAYAYRLISKRLYTEYEISEKLKKREFDPSVIKQILNELRERNYVSDLEFARLWIKARLRLKPKGEHLLKLELLKKGINKETANQALAEILKGGDQVIIRSLYLVPENRLEMHNIHLQEKYIKIQKSL